jgi:hypothetical protein
MSIPVDKCASEKDECCGAAVVSSCRVVQKVCCSVTAWTDETEGLKVLVTRRNVSCNDPVAGTTVTTDEKAMQRMQLTGTVTEKRYIESKWWTTLWQTMSRVEKRKRIETARAVERAAKRQCKNLKDGLQTEVLQVMARDWNAHIIGPKCIKLVPCNATLVKECLN